MEGVAGQAAAQHGMAQHSAAQHGTAHHGAAQGAPGFMNFLLACSGAGAAPSPSRCGRLRQASAAGTGQAGGRR